MPRYIAAFQPNHPVGWVDRTIAMNYLQISFMKPGYVPKAVFLDRKGVIRAQFDGDSEFFKSEAPNIKAQLDKLLGSSVAGAKTGAAGKKGVAGPKSSK
jgi:hypothetical protein